ncbi:septal ring lytic transglycosylase RlpA family protein [Sideroxydans sp. CL21]|uniref:septal ring lytic transglycosylase RlpA family protein n=1 Tax=Sideroxydans sp. CL21 TaxID=2600596 RepID=UPI0012A81750|nr:septal ring lytic transglycosylase RlpA family protein [Sideroxydans sp. CL21]VVC85591.1 Septum-associated rare lipoprotein A [Sideroxydans sp. CL21]
MMQIKLLLILLAALAMTACSTTKPGEKEQSAAPIVDAIAGPSGKSASAPPATGGGYLPGDGPGTDAPNLDNIPDAVPKAEPLHRYANRPYTALGKTYTPLQTTGNYKERGIASWYGKKFNGQRTSIGETYDMYGMTAAHPTLPIPSYARVTNVANGKSVIVRINDRGPFLHERIMDLSYAAAYKLGFVNTGSAEVEVESIATGANAPVTNPVETAAVNIEPITVAPIAPVATAIPVDTVGSSKGKIFLQLGAFKSAQGAESFLAKMNAELGDNGKELKLYEKNGLTRVHLGPYANESEARDAASKLASKLGFKPFVSLH